MIRTLEAQVRVDEDVRREEQKYAQQNMAGDLKRHDSFRDRSHDHRRHPYSGGRGSEHYHRQPLKEILNVECSRDKSSSGRGDSKQQESSRSRHNEELGKQGKKDQTKGGKPPRDPSTYYCVFHGAEAGHGSNYCPDIIALMDAKRKREAEAAKAVHHTTNFQSAP